MNSKLIGAVLAAGLYAMQAQAVTPQDYDIPYVGVSGLYEFGDNKRDSDDGYGLHLNFGIPLKSEPGNALEFAAFTLKRDRDIDGKPDYQRGLLANYVHEFGQFGWGSDGYQNYLPDFKPYVLGGGGLFQEDVRGDESYHFGLNAGGGLLFPLPIAGWAIRTEAIVQGQINDKSVDGTDVPVDFQLRVGLQIPLSFLYAETEVPPVSEPEAKVVPLPPDTSTSVDADGDGVPDVSDACPNTAQGLAVDIKGCVIEQNVVLKGVNFLSDSALLTEQAKSILDNISATISGQSDLRIELAGHTDDRGSENYNKVLSTQRAEAVRQYLIGKGVSSERLVAVGYGETKPVLPNDTDEGREANRRVELKALLK